jgi:hypothetical protein
MFGTQEKLAFTYDEDDLNFLYMNGVIDIEQASDKKLYAKFPNPFVQKRLFNYFSRELFKRFGTLYDPFEDLEPAIDETSLNIRNIMKLYHKYLMENRDLILKRAPRRSDMKIYEATYHFNLYMYLYRFIQRFEGNVYPEFPTGNGKIDLIVEYADKTYGIELKSYTDIPGYKKALKKAAKYGQQLKLKEISLVFFVDYINDESRKKLEIDYYDSDTQVKVVPIFIEIGK